MRLKIPGQGTREYEAHTSRLTPVNEVDIHSDQHHTRHAGRAGGVQGLRDGHALMRKEMPPSCFPATPPLNRRTCDVMFNTRLGHPISTASTPSWIPHSSPKATRRSRGVRFRRTPAPVLVFKLRELILSLKRSHRKLEVLEDDRKPIVTLKT